MGALPEGGKGKKVRERGGALSLAQKRPLGGVGREGKRACCSHLKKVQMLVPQPEKKRGEKGTKKGKETSSTKKKTERRKKKKKTGKREKRGAFPGRREGTIRLLGQV